MSETRYEPEVTETARGWASQAGHSVVICASVRQLRRVNDLRADEIGSVQAFLGVPVFLLPQLSTDTLPRQERQQVLRLAARQVGAEAQRQLVQGAVGCLRTQALLRPQQ